MNRFLTRSLILATGLATTAAQAGPFDGSATLLCALQSVMQCEAGADCTRVTPDDANLPDFIEIDVAGNIVRQPADLESGRNTAIERIETLDGKLILQGGDDGVPGIRDGQGWTIAIAEDSGKLVLSAAGDGFGTVAFGACTGR